MCMNVNYYKYTCINAHVYILCTCIYIYYIYMVYIYIYIYMELSLQEASRDRSCSRSSSRSASNLWISASNVATLLHAKVFAPMCQFSLDLQSCASVLEARLEAVFKIRQLSKEWRSSLKGFEWLTPVDMASLGWPEYLGFIYFAAAYRDAMSALLCHLADMSAV